MNDRQRVVLDMDVGIDDALAILYLAARPDVEVVALGSVHGNGYVDVTTRNALAVLELAGLRDVPVARGAADPLEVPLSVATHVHGEDGLGDTGMPDPAGRPTGEQAADQIIRLGTEAPGSLHLFAVGPLTNLGLALRRDPQALARYRSVVIMAGAGLEADDARSIMDANIAHDPDAADLVFGSGAAITMVGVNVTTPTTLEAPDQARIAASELPHARFAWRILAFYLDFYERFLGRRVASLHDPLAAGILRDPGYVTGSVDAPVGIVDSEKGARAVAPLVPSATVARRRPTRIATAVDGPRFVEDFVDALTSPLPARTGGGDAVSVTVPAGYRPLTVEEVPDYVRSRPELSALAGDGPLTVREVGDGNLNLVFIVRSDPTAPGVVLKQSLPWVRVFGEGWPLTIERARHEADAYEVHSRFSGSTTPRYHGFDPVRYVIAMEDLADLRVWRGALNDAEIHAEAAATLGTYVARIAFHTSDLGMDAEERKRLLARTVNPELCRITEDLVLTEPIRVHEHNRYDPALEPVVAALRADTAAIDGLSVLKHRFMTRGEALIHGDLHTGSVMVGGGRTVAIDPEFAFYGPVGFDLGAIWANAVIATVRAVLLDRPADFRAHVEGIVPVSWSAFVGELGRLWPSRVDGSFTDGMRATWQAAVWDDALGFAGAKAMRRMVGFAHVTDIESLELPHRLRASRIVLAVARHLLVRRSDIATPDDLAGVVRAAIDATD